MNSWRCVRRRTCHTSCCPVGTGLLALPSRRPATASQLPKSRLQPSCFPTASPPPSRHCCLLPLQEKEKAKQIQECKRNKNIAKPKQEPCIATHPSHPDKLSAALTAHAGARGGRNNWHGLITDMKMGVLLAASDTQALQHMAMGETSPGKAGCISRSSQGAAGSILQKRLQRPKHIYQNCSCCFLCSSASSFPFPRDGGWEEKGMFGRGSTDRLRRHPARPG